MKKLLLFLCLMTISLGQSQNLITNGDFESTDTGWTGAGGNLTTSGGNTYYSRTVASAGNPWDVNLSRPVSIATPSGTGYTLTFQAWSTSGRTLIAGIGLNQDPWTNTVQTVTLTSTPQRFTLNFTSNFSDASSRIIFDMGNVTGDVNIDNVVLTQTPTNLITNGDFQTADTGWVGAAGNLVTEGTDTYYSRTVASAGNPWDVNLSRPVSIATPVGTNYILSFQAWSTSGRTLIAGIGLNQDPWTNQVQTVTLTSTPQTFFLTLTSNFSDASSRIIFDMGNVTGDVNIDNVILSQVGAVSTCANGVQDGDETGIDCGGSCTACIIAPLDAAPTPTRLAENVISIFSNAYTDRVGTAFAPNWGQNPNYTQVNIAGNATNRYLNFNFVGNTFSAGGVDASTMEQLHLDIWTPDCTSFDVYILDGTAPEQKVTLTPTVSQWNSYDIDLAQYTSLTKSGIVEFKFERSDSGLKTIYLDNIYFWKTPSGFYNYYADNDGDSYGAGAVVQTTSPTAAPGFSATAGDCNDSNAAINPGATEIADGIDNDCDGSVDEGFPPATAAPTPPTRDTADVVSVYSGAYSNVTLDELPTGWSDLTSFGTIAIQSNNTWDFKGHFLGIVTNYANGIDLTNMDTMHIDYWTPDNIAIGIKLVNTTVAPVQDPIASLGTTVTGSWRSIDIPLSAYGPTFDRSKITQILIDPDGNSRIYIDNFYFYKARTASNHYVDADGDGYGTGSPIISYASTAPTGYSVNNTDCNDSNPAINPGATEVFDTIDNDCDGLTDEGVTLVAPIVTNTGICKGAVGATPSATALPGYTLVWYKDGTTTTALPSAPVITATKTFFVAQRLGAGAISPRASVTTTVNLLPTTPAVALTLGTEVIKKVGNLIGTSTALTLTATPVGTVPTASYNWTLPTNVTQVSGGSSAVITVNFAAVAPGNTALDFFVSSVSNTGCISKTAKKLTVTRAEPAKPKALVLTDALRPELLKITKLGEYTGALNTRTLTLTATPITKQGSQATSYKWVLPAGVTTTATPAGVNTYTSTLPTIAITLAGVTNQASFLFQVYAVNGNGTSLLSTNLTCSSAAPKTPGSITTPTLTKPTYNTICNNSITVQVPAALGATYAWQVSGGAVITSGQGSNVIAINTSAASATLTISVTASNGTGTSLPKTLLLKKATTCKVEATENVVADDQLTVIAFPNPSSDEFTIEASRKGASVQVYDMLGRLVEKRQATSNSVQVGRNYATGVYNVVVSQGTKVKTLKVIKK